MEQVFALGLQRVLYAQEQKSTDKNETFLLGHPRDLQYTTSVKYKLQSSYSYILNMHEIIPILGGSA